MPDAHSMSPMAALEWLLAHADDPDLETPLTDVQLQRIAARRRQQTFRQDPVVWPATVPATHGVRGGPWLKMLGSFPRGTPHWSRRLQGS